MGGWPWRMIKSEGWQTVDELNCYWFNGNNIVMVTMMMKLMRVSNPICIWKLLFANLI